MPGYEKNWFNKRKPNQTRRIDGAMGQVIPEEEQYVHLREKKLLNLIQRKASSKECADEFEELLSVDANVSRVLCSDLLCLTAGRPGEYDMVKRIWHVMEDTGLAADPVYINSMKFAAIKAGRGDDFAKMNEIMANNDYANDEEVDLITVDVAMGSFSKENDYVKAFSLYEGMCAAGIEGNENIYTHLLYMAAALGDKARVLAVVEDMLSKGIKFDKVTWSAANSVFEKTNDLQGVRQLMSMISKHQPTVVEMHRDLIRLMAKLGRPDDCHSELHSMMASGFDKEALGPCYLNTIMAYCLSDDRFDLPTVLHFQTFRYQDGQYHHDLVGNAIQKDVRVDLEAIKDASIEGWVMGLMLLRQMRRLSAQPRHSTWEHVIGAVLASPVGGIDVAIPLMMEMRLEDKLPWTEEFLNFVEDALLKRKYGLNTKDHYLRAHAASEGQTNTHATSHLDVSGDPRTRFNYSKDSNKSLRNFVKEFLGKGEKLDRETAQSASVALNGIYLSKYLYGLHQEPPRADEMENVVRLLESDFKYQKMVARLFAQVDLLNVLYKVDLNVKDETQPDDSGLVALCRLLRHMSEDAQNEIVGELATKILKRGERYRSYQKQKERGFDLAVQFCTVMNLHIARATAAAAAAQKESGSRYGPGMGGSTNQPFGMNTVEYTDRNSLGVNKIATALQSAKPSAGPLGAIGWRDLLWNLALRADREKAQRVFKLMCSGGGRPDATCWTALMYLYGREDTKLGATIGFQLLNQVGYRVDVEALYAEHNVLRKSMGIIDDISNTVDDIMGLFGRSLPQDEIDARNEYIPLKNLTPEERERRRHEMLRELRSDDTESIGNIAKANAGGFVPSTHFYHTLLHMLASSTADPSLVTTVVKYAMRDDHEPTPNRSSQRLGKSEKDAQMGDAQIGRFAGKMREIEQNVKRFVFQQMAVSASLKRGDFQAAEREAAWWSNKNYTDECEKLPVSVGNKEKPAKNDEGISMYSVDLYIVIVRAYLEEGNILEAEDIMSKLRFFGCRFEIQMLRSFIGLLIEHNYTHKAMDIVSAYQAEWHERVMDAEKKRKKEEEAKGGNNESNTSSSTDAGSSGPVEEGESMFEDVDSKRGVRLLWEEFFRTCAKCGQADYASFGHSTYLETPGSVREAPKPANMLALVGANANQFPGGNAGGQGMGAAAEDLEPKDPTYMKLTTASYGYILGALCSQKELSDAQSFIEGAIVARWVDKSASLWDPLILSLAASGNIRTCHAMMGRLRQLELTPTQFQWNMLLNACMKIKPSSMGYFSKPLTVIDTMSKGDIKDPNDHNFHFKKSQNPHVLSLLHLMTYHDRLVPEMKTYHSLLRYYRDLDDAEGVLCVLKSMHSQGVRIGANTIKSLESMYKFDIILEELEKGTFR